MRFSQVPGRSVLKAKFIHNIREGRVPHAQFFLGPRGSGNLPLALAYATYLLCEDQQADDSCGTCSSCKQMQKLAHPDLHLQFPIFFTDKVRTCGPFLDQWRKTVIRQPFLDEGVWLEEITEEKNKQLRMGMDIAADINRALGLRSFSGGWKVMLIWLPERFDLAASNKLLKILEEPEGRTVFLLVGHDMEHILPTILSRVQLVKVPPMEDEDLEEALRDRIPELGDAEARSIAQRSHGDLLEALAIAQHSDEELFVLFRGWLRACYALKVHEAQEYAEKFGAMGRERQKDLMRYALHMVRSGALQWQEAGVLVGEEGEEGQFTKDVAKLLNMRNVLGLQKELETAHMHLERNANPKLLFMDLSYRMNELLRS